MRSRGKCEALHPRIAGENDGKGQQQIVCAIDQRGGKSTQRAEYNKGFGRGQMGVYTVVQVKTLSKDQNLITRDAV